MLGAACWKNYIKEGLPGCLLSLINVPILEWLGRVVTALRGNTFGADQTMSREANVRFGNIFPRQTATRQRRVLLGVLPPRDPLASFCD